MVTTAFGARRDQPGGSQGSLAPLIAEVEDMLLPQLIAEVGDVEARVLFPVETQDLLDSGQGNFAGAGATAIE